MSSVKQSTGINMSIPHGQDMEKSAKPIIESLAILYNNNQPADLGFWNSLFAPILLFRINKFFSSNAQNITCSLLRINIFIKQHSLDDKPAKDFPKLADIGFVVWYLVNIIYESG